MTNGLIGKVTAGGGTHLIASTAYGTCTTAAATVEKIATIQDSHEFTLYDGITIHIWMQYHNTSTSPTLDVNSTGAKPIYRYGTTVPGTSASSSWNAGAVVSFTYNTNNTANGAWVMNDWANNNDNTLLRTYKAYSTNVELPLIGGSTGSTSPAAPTGETSYAALYGQIPKTTANRATYNLSTGKITVPGGVVANITGNVSGTASNVTGTVAIANGGTNASTVAGALTNLGISATTSSVTINGTTFNQYSHPTSAGYKHIPSDGSTGNILKYEGHSGTAAWGSIGNHTYTPQGDININVSAGSTTTVVNASYSNEVLTLTSTTVKNGDATFSASFSGTQATLSHTVS